MMLQLMQNAEVCWITEVRMGEMVKSRGEKARRKAEEKRQARLEKELLEEEERKQREEVARLVEERRRLRDEKMEAEKERGKGSPRAKERDSKKESERKRQERKKEKDRGSSKSNSDAEQLEKRVSKESDRNKKSESERREQNRTTPESMKAHGTEPGHGFKGAAANNLNRGNAGTRYLDRMRGTFLSSSRAFTGGGFFGKSNNTSTVSREPKPNTLVESAQTSTYRKEIVQPDRVSGRSIVNGDDKSANRPSFDNPINFGLPSPFTLPAFPFESSSSSTVLPLSSETMLSKMGDSPHQFLPEESEIFEDPCYVPDPISLLGPVSESLDNFQLDLGFVTDTGFEKPCAVKTKPAPSEVTKPSPIASPMSRSRVSDERHASSFLFPSTPKAQDNGNSINDNGTWQMWNSSPLGQDGLGLVGGPVSWLLHPDMNLPNKEDNIHPAPHKTMASLFKKDEQGISPSHPSQNVLFGNSQSGGTFNTCVPGIVDGPWLPKTSFAPTSSPENQILLKPMEEAVQNGLIFGNSSGSAANHQFELFAANSWAKNDWTVQGARDGVGNSPISKPHIGGLYTPPDVQSLWSYD
ncbi:UNVERIFIED_CONTAM: hypothetical protein Scaly_1771000 [Sesamum calycinum]|uniref:Stress response NST1-like protein n=1 Tax=Sesamum calycinum TaxID=2727403 RepID=A0AAW2NUK8_9LAMI